jgi:hypothetical protein
MGHPVGRADRVNRQLPMEMAWIGGAHNGWRGTALQRRSEKTGLTRRGREDDGQCNKIAVSSAAELSCGPNNKYFRSNFCARLSGKSQ